MTKIPENPQLGHEYISTDEDAIIVQMMDEMVEQVDKLYKDKKMLRQVHTKMHGCVRASFTVEPNLEDDLRVGIFAKPATYNCWVRFSNGNTKIQPDKKKDIRGCAIKIMGVEGEKILNDEYAANTQDFLLMSSETFFSHNLHEFRKIMKASTKSTLSLLFYLLNPLHWGLVKKLSKTTIKCDNPLSIPYWSTQPYQFGSPDRAVKYFLKPSPDNHIINANTSDENYLRTNLAQTLNNRQAEFEFYVQLQTDPVAMPIEDPTVPWGSQFQKVATLTIPPQSFDSPEQMEFGDNLSFNAWHSLPDHRPLGSFNRARKRVYEAMSAYRHKKNGIVAKEPTAGPEFLLTGHQKAPDSLDETMPKKGVLLRRASAMVNCTQKTAYEFVSSGPELCNWLKKAGPVPGALNVEDSQPHYNHVGDKRKVVFNGGDSCYEELMSLSPYANYTYKVTKFSNFLKYLTSIAYAQMWFDNIDGKTRITWVYAFTYKNIIARAFLSMFLTLAYSRYMKNALQNAKGQIENGLF